MTSRPESGVSILSRPPLPHPIMINLLECHVECYYICPQWQVDQVLELVFSLDHPYPTLLW